MTTYWLAGVAKVMGPLGWNWALGVALRDQIAVDAIRKEVLSGQSASALAFALYPYSWIFTCMGVGTLVLEIGAPLFMMRRRWAMIWAVLALMMHWGIYLIMGITFRYQLCGLVVASFFPIERPVIAALRRWSPRSSAFHQSLRLSKAVPLVLVVCLVGATAGVLLWPFVVPRQTLTAHPLVAGSQSPTLPTKTDIDEAINHASDYLRTHRQDNGRWIYRTDLANSQVDRRSYNILRHAGAIYALSVAHQRSANDDNVPVIHAAVQFLNDQVRPVSNQYDVRAVWSDVDFRDPKHPYTAKLGGAGLGLLALMTAQEAVHVYIPDPIPQSLGNFLLSMQEPNGRMRSKWVDGADTGSQWESLYYPGEAALGLIRLSEFCQDMRYAQAAQRLLLYLARERKSLAQVPPDHWALIATRQLLQPISILHDRLSLTDDERRELLDHAAQISRSMLDEQKSVVGPPLIVGSFTSDGRTTPTATRLEGLLAMHPLFQAEANTRPLSREIAKAAERGIAFLLRAQVVQGPQRGGFPRAIGTWEPAESIEQQEANRLASEIRIDYVQHALCALIEYERLREYKR